MFAKIADFPYTHSEGGCGPPRSPEHYRPRFAIGNVTAGGRSEKSIEAQTDESQIRTCKRTITALSTSQYLPINRVTAWERNTVSN